MIYFIGDTHGKTFELTKLVQRLPVGSQKFQLGDMGLGFRDVYLSNLKNFRFIRGNHDNPKLCQAHFNYAGEYGYLENENLFFLGGAWSIDQAWRIEGVSWWRDEEQSIVALNAAQQLYVEKKPRIVATHETPTTAVINLLTGLSGGYFEAKKECKNTRTSQVLQQMFEAHQPEHWFFGHYHVDKNFEIGGCQFHCLAELSVKELSL